VCGEFLSPECIPYLHNWNIHPQPIPKVVLRTSNNKSLTFSFPTQAGGLSHIQLDPLLAKYAQKAGTVLKTSTQVKSIQPKKKQGDPHVIQLSNGETIESSQMIIAMGRIPSYSLGCPTMRYVGFKAHFKNIVSEGNLEMYSFPGGYLGMAPIEENQCNVACLADVEMVKQFTDPHAFIENLIVSHPFLSTSLSKENSLFDQWMITEIPSFGIRQTPEWLDAYFIGDAAVSIPPACGNGLSMAIIGGRLAAEYAVGFTAEKFKKMWKNKCASQVFWAKSLHKLLLHPFYGDKFLAIGNLFPYLSRKVYDLTRQSIKK
jgi:menaquinone-9 beta-reductase